MSISKLFSLDLWKNKPITIDVKQNDAGRNININLKANGEEVDLTGKTVKYFIKKGDGNTVFNNCNILEGKIGSILVPLTKQAITIEGTNEMELAIYDENGAVESTFTVYLQVTKTLIDNNAIESSNEFKALNDALGMVQGIDNKFKAVNSQLDTNTNYQKTVSFLVRNRLLLETTDDNAINEAINNSHSNVIILPKREYLITKSIRPKEGQKIYCSWATIKNEIIDCKPVFEILQSGIEIYDFTVINTLKNNAINNTTTQSFNGSTVCIGSATNTELIKNVKITNGSSLNSIGGVSAFICTGNVENIKFVNCYVNGIQIKQDESFICGFHAEWNGNILSCKNVAFENCIVENLTKSNTYAFYISSVKICTLKNCKANNVSMGIMLYDGDKGTENNDIDNIIVENCVVENYSQYGISIKSRNELTFEEIRSTLRNNTIKNCTTNVGCAIRIHRNKGGIRIEDNKIIGAFDGIRIEPTLELMIRGNEFKEIINQNISCIQLQNSIIKENIFCSNNVDGADIMLEYLSTNNDILNNKFIGDGSKFNIQIKSETNLSYGNKINYNDFNADFGLVNGVSGDLTKGLKTYFRGNKNLKENGSLKAGASIFDINGDIVTLYHPALVEFSGAKNGDRIINTSPYIGSYTGWLKMSDGIWRGYGVIS